MSIQSFESFDPLQVRSYGDSSLAAQRATRREIENILSSYVGWFDPFCELIQNALDAVDKMAVTASQAGEDYSPTVRVIVDLVQNRLTVTDNGIGMSAEEFKKFLAPNFSFKEQSENRGHKGVGATYLAYAFNFLRIHTKAPGFDAIGRITGARIWLSSALGTDAPKVEPDASEEIDLEFSEIARGTSVSVRFDEDSQPGRLDWLSAKSADVWFKLLSNRTAIGAIDPVEGIKVEVVCIAKDGETSFESEKIGYQWLRNVAPRTAAAKDIQKARAEAFEKHGDPKKLPKKYSNLSIIYERWEADEIKGLLSTEEFEQYEDLITRHAPVVQFEYGYSTKIWRSFNESLGVRAGFQAIKPGIQLAANNMPQGDVIQVPLTKYIGRQNQVHFLIHFQNYTPDLGRKGFSKPLVDFASDLAKAVIQNKVPPLRSHMKRDTGAAPDMQRQMALTEWKTEMAAHEEKNPLVVESEHFFHPTKKISITSVPTREQDVIALFHELLSGGVIRGMRILSTNERSTYDSLCRISYEDGRELLEYEEERNPLGIASVVLDGLHGKNTDTRVMEYKFSLDGLMGDLDSLEKNIRDLDICVAWEMGESYQEQFSVQTLLVPENIESRQFHGATHHLQNADSGAHEVTLIILKDLVEVLVDPEAAYQRQRDLHE